MTANIDSHIDFSIPKIVAVLVDRPEGFPDEAQVGQGTIGAMAVGADSETAGEINIAMHVSPNIESQIGGSKYLAGAVLYLTLKELEES